MTLADQIVLLKDGEVLQQDSPRQIYNRPSRRFGGWFPGNPGMSFLEHSLDPKNGPRLRSDLFPFAVSIHHPEVVSKASPTTVVFRVRPEHVRVFTEPRAEAVEGRILRKFGGVAGQYPVAIQLQDHVVWAKVPSRLGCRLQEQVWFDCPPEAVILF